MRLSEFDALVGQDSYVRCMGKKRLDNAIVNAERSMTEKQRDGRVYTYSELGRLMILLKELLQTNRAPDQGR